MWFPTPFKNVGKQQSAKCNNKPSNKHPKAKQICKQARVCNHQPLFTVILPLFTFICRYSSSFAVKPKMKQMQPEINNQTLKKQSKLAKKHEFEALNRYLPLFYRYLPLFAVIRCHLP